MSKDTCKLSLTGLIKGVTLISLVTEGRELGYSSQEVCVSVNRVCQGETSVPVCLAEE